MNDLRQTNNQSQTNQQDRQINYNDHKDLDYSHFQLSNIDTFQNKDIFQFFYDSTDNLYDNQRQQRLLLNSPNQLYLSTQQPQTYTQIDVKKSMKKDNNSVFSLLDYNNFEEKAIIDRPNQLLYEYNCNSNFQNLAVINKNQQQQQYKNNDEININNQKTSNNDNLETNKYQDEQILNPSEKTFKNPERANQKNINQPEQQINYLLKENLIQYLDNSVLKTLQRQSNSSSISLSSKIECFSDDTEDFFLQIEETTDLSPQNYNLVSLLLNNQRVNEINKEECKLKLQNILKIISNYKLYLQYTLRQKINNEKGDEIRQEKSFKQKMIDQLNKVKSKKYTQMKESMLINYFIKYLNQLPDYYDEFVLPIRAQCKSYHLLFIQHLERIGQKRMKGDKIQKKKNMCICGLQLGSHGSFKNHQQNTHQKSTNQKNTNQENTDQENIYLTLDDIKCDWLYQVEISGSKGRKSGEYLIDENNMIKSYIQNKEYEKYYTKMQNFIQIQKMIHINHQQNQCLQQQNFIEYQNCEESQEQKQQEQQQQQFEVEQKQKQVQQQQQCEQFDVESYLKQFQIDLEMSMQFNFTMIPHQYESDSLFDDF